MWVLTAEVINNILCDEEEIVKMKQQKDYLNDMEEQLEEKEYPEKMIKIVQSMANFYISQEQLANKGNLLGHFKSGRFLKT